MNLTVSHRRVLARRVLRIMALLLCSGAGVGRATAQSARAPLGVWLTGGVGGGGGRRSEGIAVAAAVTAQRAPHQLTARAVGLIISAEGGGEEMPVEFSLLYGLAHRSRWHNAAINAGLGVVTRYNCDSIGSNCKNVIRPGLPLSAEITLRFLPTLGLGLQVFGNVNSIASSTGILLTMHVGWLP